MASGACCPVTASKRALASGSRSGSRTKSDAWRLRELSSGYLRELRRCRLYFAPLAERSIHSINFGALEEWAVGLRVKGKTRHNILGAMHAFLRWLERRGEIDKAPEVPRTTVDEYVPSILSLEAQDSVIAAIPDERRGAFLTARLGVRPGAVRAFNCADVQGNTPVVSAAMKGPNANAPRRGPKTRRFQVVPMDGELREWIARHRRDAIGAAPLFPNPTAKNSGGRWTARALQKEWHRAAASVGVRCGMYEGTKHTSATHAPRRGVPLDQIAQALGHTDLRSTERYARLAAQMENVLRPECTVSALLGPTEKSQ